MASTLIILVNTGFGLIATSLLLLILSIIFVRKKDFRKHQVFMTGAMVTSALFLVVYVTRWFMFGDQEFHGPDTVRNFVYLPILFIHITFAVISLVLVLKQVVLTYRNYEMSSSNQPVLKDEIRSTHKKNGPRAALIWGLSFSGGIITFFLLYVLY